MPTITGYAPTQATASNQLAEVPRAFQPQASPDNPLFYQVTTAVVGKPPHGVSVWGVMTTGGGGGEIEGEPPAPTSGQIFPTGRA